MKKVNILGTLYKIYFDAPDEKLPEGCDGCMDQSIHQIRIAIQSPKLFKAFKEADCL